MRRTRGGYRYRLGIRSSSAYRTCRSCLWRKTATHAVDHSVASCPPIGPWRVPHRPRYAQTPVPAARVPQFAPGKSASEIRRSESLWQSGARPPRLTDRRVRVLSPLYPPSDVPMLLVLFGGRLANFAFIQWSRLADCPQRQVFARAQTFHCGGSTCRRGDEPATHKLDPERSLATSHPHAYRQK